MKSNIILDIFSKIKEHKIYPNELCYKQNIKNNSITPRQSNIHNNIYSNTSTKITVNKLNNNEEKINSNLTSQMKSSTRTNKSREKKIHDTEIKKSISNQKMLLVNKPFHTNDRSKNKKNELKKYDSLVNSLFNSYDNKGYITTTSTNKIKHEINSSQRERNKSKQRQKKQNLGYVKSFCDENNGNKNKNFTISGFSTSGKNLIKKTKSNNNININLNNNFNNIIINNINISNKLGKNENINNFTNIIYDNNNSRSKVIKNDTESNLNNTINNNIKVGKKINNKKYTNVRSFNLSKPGDNLNKKRNNKKIGIIKDINIEKNTKKINHDENTSLYEKNNKKNSKYTKKLLNKAKTNRNIENDDNKSIYTIKENKMKINTGRTSLNKHFYNIQINTKSTQTLSPLNSKLKQNIYKKNNSIKLLGSYDSKKKNDVNLKNKNIINSVNLKNKISTNFTNKKINLKNKNKKNIKIINSKGVYGTQRTLLNKEEQNLTKVIENKKNKNKSSQHLKYNQENNINNVDESIEIKNDNIYYSYKNSKKIIKKNKKKLISKPKLDMKKIQSLDINENNDNMNINEISIKNEEILNINPNTPSSRFKKFAMTKKTKSVNLIHQINKNEKQKEDNERNEAGERLKKCPLSKINLNRPKLNDKIIIKFEDLLTFEKKLNDIIVNFSNKDNIDKGGVSNECAEFMTFYFHSSLYGIFINFFNPNNKIIIHSGNNLLLLSIIISYHLSINPKMLTNLLDDMKYIFSLLKINYLLLIKKIEIYYDDEFPIKYIDILNQKLGQIKIINCSNEIDIISKINKNCCNIAERIKLILNYYQRNNDQYFNEFNGIFKNISTVSEKNINNYFQSYLYVNPFTFESNEINSINNINNNYICSGSSKNFSSISNSISLSSNSSLKEFDDNNSDNFIDDNISNKTEKSDDCERELLSVKSYKSSNYYGKLKQNNLGSIINCDNNFYYSIENNIYENDEDGTNSYEIMQMIKNYEINKVNAPFLVSPPKKKYTLVLDLDETLIHLRQKKEVVNIKNDINIKINNTSDNFYSVYDRDKNKYLLQFRVGLFSFLTILKPFYEIISFTSATREYADVIINEIEKNRTFFDHKLYREHTVIYKDSFVKDISRIGRDIKKIIIIDNNEGNFILNKENGIKIAPFYGDEENNNNVNNSINSENNSRLSYRRKKRSDNVLLELKNILVMIYKDDYDDLREALKDYDDLIKSKVSMNL